MKFLVDARLPSMMCDILHQIGFEALHVNSLPEGDETPDRAITTVADDNGYIIVTKDSDFYYSHMI